MNTPTIGSANGTQYGSANWAPIPAQQQQWLNQLASTGQLSGIPPQYLAAMDWAESNGMGGAVNSKGYGGFFGLAPNTNYVNGSLSQSQLTGTDQASFNAQAVTAAAQLASLIKSNGGNVYAAESQYQGGGTEGASIMQTYGLSTTLDPSTLTAPPSVNGGSTTSGSPGALMGPCNKSKCIIGTPFGVGGCLMDDCQAKAFVSGLIVIGGVVTILVGVLALAGSTKAGRQIAELPMVGGAAAWGAKRMMGASGGGKVTEKKAQTRETAAYNRGHSEGKTMASKGSSVPKGSSYKPRPEDADFAVEAA